MYSRINKKEETKTFNPEDFYYYTNTKEFRELDEMRVNDALNELKQALEEYYGGKEHSAIITTAIENMTEFVRKQVNI